MTKRKEKGRALFYTRDSGGKHEMTPSEYVGWAQRRAEELGVEFNGTSEAIEAMIRDGRSVSGDLFLDFGVQGNILSRTGLDALIKTAVDDLNVSHVMIPRRNRLARPNDPLDGIKLENALRAHGVSLVFMDRLCPPLPRGKRPEITDLISAAIDYDRSAEDRRELAQKVLVCSTSARKTGLFYRRKTTLRFSALAGDGGRQTSPTTGGWRVREDARPSRPLAAGSRRGVGRDTTRSGIA
jgi:hypothetical protein